ncbi:hypothetical protein SCUCBS95973_008433 [Sporothrix curviconia]|uniref:RING-type domain-containing protein n=1 Tax=Sporothrix curviconia TaxID=1260050 RepID=A0ABP0CPE8_9PEZI
MARRAPAGDSGEDYLPPAFSGTLGDFIEQYGLRGNIDDLGDVSGDIDTVTALVNAGFAQLPVFGNSDEDEDDDYDDDYDGELDDEELEEGISYVISQYEGYLSDDDDYLTDGYGDDDHPDNSTPPPNLPAPAPFRHAPAISQLGRNSSQSERHPLQLQAATRLPLGLSLINDDSAISIDEDEDEDDEDDDLEFLGQNDFSSPSILNDSNTPLYSSPARRNPNVEAMPRTRRRTAEERTASVVADPLPPPLPADAAAVSNATLGRPRTRSGSNFLTSPLANAPGSASRTSRKRRRSGEAGPSGTTLPPIADLLASVGNSSGSSSSQQVDSQASSSNSSSNPPNRPRVSPKRPRREEAIVLDDDLFGSDDDGDAGVQMVNLVDVDRPQAAQAEGTEGGASQNDEAAAAAAATPPAPAPKKTLIRLSAQQCVICMDNMSNLTTTHCGHIFCGECLHASLSMDSSRRICPICRTKVEMRVPNMAATRLARSVFPLQLKMRARNQKGKQLDSSY